jgi:hypothetical protein
MFAGFVPIIFAKTVNNYSSAGISIFIYLLSLYYFVKSMNNTKFIRHFIISLIILIFVTPVSVILIASFLIYFILLKAEKIKIRLSEVEIFLFSLILGGWIYIIIYKKAILQKGLLFFLHPTLNSSGGFISLSTISMIGIIPILLGIFGVYFNIVKKGSRQIVFISSFVITTIVFVVFELINIDFALSLVAIGLIICSGIALKEGNAYFEKSKVKKFYTIILVAGFIIFIVTSVIPSITSSIINTHDSPTIQDKEAFEWVKTNTKEDSMLISNVDETYAVSYFTKRDNVLKKYNIKNEQKLEEVKDFYSITLSTEAIRTLSRYDVDYVILTKSTIEKINPKILDKFEVDCFSKEFNNSAIVYKKLCTIEKERELNKETFEDAQ